MSFPDKLKSLRANKGISQKSLAKEIGVSQASVGYWEKGERTPSVDAGRKLADYFNIPLDELYETHIDLDYDVDKLDINLLLDMLKDGFFFYSKEEALSIENDVKNELIHCNDKFDLLVNLSHRIVKDMLERYSEYDITDIAMLLNSYLKLNNSGQSKVQEYTDDLLGNRYYKNKKENGK